MSNGITSLLFVSFTVVENELHVFRAPSMILPWIKTCSAKLGALLGFVIISSQQNTFDLIFSERFYSKRWLVSSNLNSFAILNGYKYLLIVNVRNP